MATYTLGSGALAGVRIRGTQTYQQIGRDLSPLGDVNGDGIDDFITLVSFLDSTSPGGAYVIFGKEGGIAPLNTDAAASDLGLTVRAPGTSTSLVEHVGAAGDVNGDGLQDFLISDPRYNEYTGRVYLVYGSTALAGTINLANLGASNGVTFNGLVGRGYDTGDWFGSAITSVGDVNADGIDDFFIGAHGSNAYGTDSGRGWVVYGKLGGIGSINFAAIAPADGFELKGGPGMFAGENAAGLGDVNGDGIDDFVVAAVGGTGKVFVVFGKAGGTGPIDLANMTPGSGFSIGGTRAFVQSGEGAGDVNGDGLQDIIVRAGNRAYVVFGVAGGSANFELGSTIPTGQGFILDAPDGVYDAESAGDLNGDGFGDLIVGTPSAYNFSTQARDAGKAYVVYGGPNLTGTISLSSMNDATGFVLQETTAEAFSGLKAGAVGDLNHDGLSDIVVAAPNTNAYRGTNYLIYGMLPGGALTRTGAAGNQTIQGGAQGDFLNGLAGNDRLVGNGGDDRLTGDAGNDALVGGDGTDTADYSVEGGPSGVIVNLHESLAWTVTLADSSTRTVGAGQAIDSYGNTDTLSGIENVVTGSRDDFVMGSSASNRIEGGAGNDLLNGGAGNDGVIGGSGNDRLFGAEGDDQLEGGDDNDELDGGPGNDFLLGGAGNDRLFGGADDDLIDSGTGFDQADGGDGIDGVIADVSGLSGSVSWSLGNGGFHPGLHPNVSFDNFEYFKSLKTGAGNDNIMTRDLVLDDRIEAGAGNDDVWVFNGNDTVNGEAGNDILRVSYVEGVATAVTTSGFADWAGGGYSGTISTAGRSVVFGGIENFVIATGSGNDVIRTGAGNDTVWLNEGDDFVDLGGGFDQSHGGAGTDGISADMSGQTQQIVFDFITGTFVIGNTGQSTLFSGFEYVGTLVTGSGNDFVLTNALGKDEMVITGPGNDFVSVANGYDQVGGGAGTDFLEILYSTATTPITTSPFSGTFATGYTGAVYAADRSVAFSGMERFRMIGGSADDLLYGGDGNDQLDGGGGADTMIAGLGNDTYVVDNEGDFVGENAGGGTDSVWTTLAAYVLKENFENLTAINSIAHDLRGNAADNVITGAQGADFVRMYDGGVDRVLGLGGADTILFGSTFSAADFVDGGEGSDTLALQGNYTLTFGTGLVSNIANLENIALLSGVNTRFGESGTQRYSYNFTMIDANVGAGQVLRVNGGNLVAGEHFTFDGRAETDGGFVVYGGLGTDILRGGTQTDVFFFGDSLSYAPGDIADGGAGYDGLFFRGDYTIDFTQPGYENGLISIENITLSSASDERHQRGGDGEFDYHVILSDAIVQPGTLVTINGGLLMANETMYLDASRETNGHLRLFGGAANDTLIAGEGNDLVYGGRGADQLAGGGGADTFRYDETADSNAAATDRITLFTPNVDKIDLSRVDANSLAAGDQAFRWIGAGAFSSSGPSSAGELRTSIAVSGIWTVEGDTDGNGTADFVITMTTPGNMAISEADFFF